jgi:RNA polymerase sigma-70 factor, ECF subfamily
VERPRFLSPGDILRSGGTSRSCLADPGGAALGSVTESGLSASSVPSPDPIQRMSAVPRGEQIAAGESDTQRLERLLKAHGEGDRSALAEIFSLIYLDLHGIARNHLRNERGGHTLNTTALVHEAYLKLAPRHEEDLGSRARFFAIASTAMRRILVDHARRRSAGKRGGDGVHVTLHTGIGATDEGTTELLELNEALERLAALDPRLEKIVECRFFGGMNSRETATALEVSTRTVERDWLRAKTYLFHLLHPEGAPT